MFYTFMIPYIDSLMHAVTYTALLGTMNMVASALGQNLIWGKLSDRHKLRAKLIVAGEFIAAIAYLLVFLVHRSLIDAQANFNAGLSLILGLSVLEFFWSMSDVGWAALLTDVTTVQNRGGIVGALNSIASFGRIVGIGFSGFLFADGLGFYQGTIFYIVIIMLLSTSALMWVTSRYEKKSDRSELARPAISQEASKTTSYERENRKSYAWFLAALIVIIIGASSVNQVFILFIELPEGLNAAGAGTSLVMIAWTLGGMVASLGAGWFADRIGRNRSILAGLLLAALTPALYGMASSLYIMALFYGINGAAFWTIQTVGFALAGDMISDDRRARMLGRYNAVIALSWGPAGLLVGAPLADIQTKLIGIPTYGAYLNTFYASSIIVFVGIVLFVLRVSPRITWRSD